MAAVDLFVHDTPQLNSPYSSSFVITPDDDNELDFVTRGVYIGGDGNLDVMMLDGSDMSFDSQTAGTILPIRIKMVYESSTATDLKGLY